MPLNPNPYPVASRVYMPYVIYSHSASEVTAWRAEHGYGLVEGPKQAATRLGLPYPPGGPLTDKGLFYKYPFLPAFKIPIIVDPAEQFPSALDDWIVMGGPRRAPDGTIYPTVALTWIGIFQQMGGKAGNTYPPTAPAPTVPMSRRRHVDGFETPAGERNVSANVGNFISRDASRTSDGYGGHMRPGITGVLREHRVMEETAPFGTSDRDLTWERVYIRLRKAPTTGETEIWYAKAIQSSGTQGAEGTKLFVDPGGRINIYSINNSSALTLVGAGPVLALNVWTRLDIVHTFSGVSPTLNPGRFASIRIYVNGVQATSVSTYPIVNQVRANTNRHDLTRIGNGNAGGAEIDFDDWIGADVPILLVGDPLADPGIGLRSPDYTALEAQYDFQAGSHCQRIHATAFGAAHAGTWAGDFRALVQRPGSTVVSAAPTFAPITSTTSGARAEIETNLRANDPNFWTDIFQLGAASFIVSALLQVTTDGTGGLFGHHIGAGADVDSSTSAAGKVQASRSTYQPSGLFKPETVTPLRLHYKKSTNANQVQVYNLHAVIELLGAYGPEDAISVDAPVVLGAFNGIHNAPYSPSAWSAYAPAPLSPIVVQTGTYVGNGTGQDIALAAPAHLLFVRNTATHEGVRWWTSMLGSHLALARGGKPHLVNDARLLEDTVNSKINPVVRIAGTDAAINAAGVTYRYVAISDPGQRFMINGAGAHGDLGPVVNALLDTAFTPTWAFFHDEEVLSTSATSAQWAKGPGNSADGASLLSLTETAEAATFAGAGQVTTRLNLHTPAVSQFAYSLLRTVDGSGEAGRVVFQILSYIGDGVSPRTITLTPTSGRRPLFAVIVPRNAASIYRDPSHAGTNSCQYPETNVAANGIRGGGIDQILVGSSLNTSGINYSVLVIPGGVTGNADGWSDPTGGNPDLPGVFIPAPTTGTPGGPAPAPPPDPGTGGGGSGTAPGSGDGPILDVPDITDDLADTACVTPTTKVANLALSRVGVNKQIGTLLTEASPEATAIRLHYDLALQGTLGDRPWRFATRYATLTLLTGSVASPANGEWTYAHRLPDNCLVPRRLVTARGRAIDPEGPPFQLGQGVLFTNETSAKLEYTARIHCPARVTDTVFLNAWAWRLAHEIAPALTRMPEKVKQCWDQYQAALAVEDGFRRLGNPGLRPTADPNDPDTACAAVKLQVINVGLVRIGAQTIADLATEQSREAVSAALVYEDELKATLRDFPWGFAKRYADPLTLVRGPAWATATVQAWSASQAYTAGDVVTSGGTVYYCLLAHTNQVPPNATYWTTTPTTAANVDWQYAYRVPADSLMARRLVRRGTGRAFDPNPPTFELGSDAAGDLIFAQESDLVLEYTIRPNCALSIGDALFRDAFAWRIAAVLAPSLAALEPEQAEQIGRVPEADAPRRSESGALRLQQLREQRARWAWGMYGRALVLARSSAANEQQQERSDEGDADWIRGR